VNPVVAPSASAAGLYIHVPFCTSVCPYCDFAVTIAGAERRAAWADGVVREAAMHAVSGLEFDTVYFGGGTPSSLTIGRISEVLAGLRRELGVRDDARLHIEVNPEDVTPENVTGWLELGVRFVSLGVQSLIDAELRFLGRRHTAAEAETAARILVEAGFETVSIDLIYGMKGQTPVDLRAQLERAVALGVQHLSCYQLTFHEGTVFGRRLHQNLVSELPAEDEAELFFLTHEVLSDLGMAAYEVSNFAAGRAHRSAHNRKYWDHSPYLGIGPSAHSWIGGRRWWNFRKLRLWQREVDSGRVPIDGHERPTPNQLVLEALMLGLRTTDGVDVDRVRGLTGIDMVAANLTTLERLTAAGLVVVDGQWIRPTLEGMAVADSLAKSLVLTD
jgi:putative oxygen-independent coproporphyrinogen III oxidase